MGWRCSLLHASPLVLLILIESALIDGAVDAGGRLRHFGSHATVLVQSTLGGWGSASAQFVVAVDSSLAILLAAFALREAWKLRPVILTGDASRTRKAVPTGSRKKRRRKA